MIKHVLSQLISYLSIGCMLVFVLSCKNDLKRNTDNLVFKYNEHAIISTLDPAFANYQKDVWAANIMFNGLVQIDNNLNVIPLIAKNWTISDDAITYTFNLRDDVKFHPHELFGKDSTRTVKAADFVYSLNRIRDPKLASPGSWVMRNVNTLKAINDTTLEITLKQPFPAFLGLLTMQYCSVVPKEIVEHYGNNFRSNPIGTGPFKFKRWEENIKLVFRKNPHYFETDEEGNTLPYLEAVAITFLPDKQSEFLQFIQGNIDYLDGIDPSYKDDILTANGQLRDKYKTDIDMSRGPYLNTNYIGFYQDSKAPEIKSRLIRQAVSYGFDREKMMSYLGNGIGFPGYGGIIPKGLAGHDNSVGYNYQPEKAKALIEEYKKTTGDQEPEITLTTTSISLNYCEYIQRELEKIGLSVNIDVMTPPTKKDAQANGKLDAYRASWIADYPDAENFLSLLYSKNFAPNGPNYVHFKNKQFDDWYEEAFKITNIEERKMVYKKMDSLAMVEAPVVIMYYDEIVRFTRKNVKGLPLDPTNLLDLKRVRKD